MVGPQTRLMSATQDIIATYRGPGKVVRRLLDRGVREDRALIYLMIACLLVFVAQMPRLAREAFETGTDLRMQMGATLMAWLFIAPLLLYLLAAVTFALGRLFRAPITSYGARIALFWALLSTTPILLLWGLTAGFVGPGLELNLVGGLWCIAFAWFWGAGLLSAARGGAT